MSARPGSQCAKCGAEVHGEELCGWCEADVLRLALRNVRGLALKTAKANPETSRHLLRFCDEAGVTGSVLRGGR